MDDLPSLHARLQTLREQVERNERVVYRISTLFDDLGIGNMSSDERAALPRVLRRELRSEETRRAWDRRSAIIVAIMSLLGTILGSGAGNWLHRLWGG